MPRTKMPDRGDDPIIDDPQELTHDQSDTAACEYCGDAMADLFTLDDSDPAVGYFNEIRICLECMERIRR